MSTLLANENNRNIHKLINKGANSEMVVRMHKFLCVDAERSHIRTNIRTCVKHFKDNKSLFVYLTLKK